MYTADLTDLSSNKEQHVSRFAYQERSDNMKGLFERKFSRFQRGERQRHPGTGAAIPVHMDRQNAGIQKGVSSQSPALKGDRAYRFQPQRSELVERSISHIREAGCVQRIWIRGLMVVDLELPKVG